MESIVGVKRNWLDISIKEYYDIQKIVHLDIDGILMNIKLYSMLNNINEDYLHNIPMHKLTAKLKELQFINEKLPKYDIKDNIEIGGKTFHINLDIGKLTTSEYLDYVHYLQIPDNIHLIVSLFVKPCIKHRNMFGKVRYEMVEMDRKDIQEYLLENMSIVYANELLLFFSKMYNRLMIYYMEVLKT